MERRFIVQNLDRDGNPCGVPTPPLTHSEAAFLIERRTGQAVHEVDRSLSLSPFYHGCTVPAKDGHQYNPVRVEIA